MNAQNSFTFALNPAQQEALIQLLREGHYRPVLVEHTQIAADGTDCRIALYKTGKCLVQGRGAADFVSFVLEPLILKEAQLGYEEVLDPARAQPHMGVDESGKGDFFGPLVVACAYVDHTLLPRMKELNVRDSKRIQSDDVALAMARDLRKLLGVRYSIVLIGPARYNQLYARMRSVNTLLAWGHARAIENLLEKLPSCPRVISDQFGNKKQVERALMQRGRKIELVQRPHAESDPAVAAASVLARAAFLTALKKMEQQFAVPFPKGAADAVKEAAGRLIQAHGPETLLQTAKCHFRTTDDVLAAAGLDRNSLGPDGAATSRPRRPFGRSAKA